MYAKPLGPTPVAGLALLGRSCRSAVSRLLGRLLRALAIASRVRGLVAGLLAGALVITSVAALCTS